MLLGRHIPSLPVIDGLVPINQHSQYRPAMGGLGCVEVVSVHDNSTFRGPLFDGEGVLRNYTRLPLLSSGEHRALLAA